MKQSIEYEWRPLYCTKCQKVGHNCDKQVKPSKEWRLKMSIQHSRVEDKPYEMTKDDEPSSENEEWTRVTNSRRDNGKGVVNDGTYIQC